MNLHVTIKAIYEVDGVLSKEAQDAALQHIADSLPSALVSEDVDGTEDFALLLVSTTCSATLDKPHKGTVE
jgi:hypothetical protein